MKTLQTVNYKFFHPFQTLYWTKNFQSEIALKYNIPLIYGENEAEREIV